MTKAVFTLNLNYIQLKYNPGYHTPFNFLSLLLVLSLLREVFLRVLRFSPLLKNQHSKFQLDLESVPN